MFWGIKRTFWADAPTAKHAPFDKKRAASESDFVRVMANNSEGDFYICFTTAFHSFLKHCRKV